jgi:hypothetical protein
MMFLMVEISSKPTIVDAALNLEVVPLMHVASVDIAFVGGAGASPIQFGKDLHGSMLKLDLGAISREKVTKKISEGPGSCANDRKGNVRRVRGGNPSYDTFDRRKESNGSSTTRSWNKKT